MLRESFMVLDDFVFCSDYSAFWKSGKDKYDGTGVQDLFKYVAFEQHDTFSYCLGTDYKFTINNL